MLDLFCGRLGWSKAFLERGWNVVGVDLVWPPETPQGFRLVAVDVLTISLGNWRHPMFGYSLGEFDFICASPPCEEFSVHGMKHFHPNPKYPENGIRLFNHTREICEASGVPYVMENVRAAQQFVGQAVHHCGPFYLWGTGVPAIMPQGIRKGISQAVPDLKNKSRAEITAWRREHDPMWNPSHSKERQAITAQAATIPPELANCVADYACNLITMSNDRELGRVPVVTSSE
jgi:hypothetical protein